MKLDLSFEQNQQNINFPFSESGGQISTDFGETSIIHDGQNGATFYPNVSAEGVISWTNDRGLDNPLPVNIKGKDGIDGKNGADGYTPIKNVDYFDGKDGVDGVNGKDGYTPIKGIDYFDGKDGTNGTDGKDGYTPVKGKDYFDGKDGIDGKNGIDGKDGFSPVVAVDDIENGHRVTITDKDGTKTFDVMDGKDGTGGGGGTNADWSVNDPEADGYVKNRTHWIEQAFEPIYADDVTIMGADTIDASALGLGLFVKISDQVISWEQLNGSTIECGTTTGYYGKNYVECLPIEETLGFTMAYFLTIDDSGYDLSGYLFVAPSAMDIPEYGLSIPSAGTYIDINSTKWSVKLEKVKIHQIDEKYVPYKKPYYLDTSLIVSPDGLEYAQKIDSEKEKSARSINLVFVGLFWKTNGLYIRVPVSFAGEGSNQEEKIQIVQIDDDKYLFEFYLGGHMSIRATPFKPEEYQTESQVKALINDAIGVIENGSY